MFISNIIYKLSAIIYKLGIIYKATTAPTNKDQQPCSTNINTGSIESLHTTYSHTQHTTTISCPSISFAHTSLITTYILALLFSLIFLIEHQIPLFCRSSPVKDTFPSRHVKFRTPLDHVNPNVSRFQILVSTFGPHCGAAVKHTSWLLVNPLPCLQLNQRHTRDCSLNKRDQLYTLRSNT